MKIKKYKAKVIDGDYIIHGFYYQCPKYTANPLGDGAPDEPEIEHFIVSWMPGDWGLPGQTILQKIDPEWLQEEGEVEVKTN